MFNLTSEDVAALAVIATIVLGIGGIVERVITTRANINAKRSEIAFAKRIEAFQNIHSALMRLSGALFHITSFHRALATELHDATEEELRDVIKDNEHLSGAIKEFHKEYDAFLDVNAQYRVFLPPHIDRLVLKCTIKVKWIGEELKAAPKTVWSEIDSFVRNDIAQAIETIVKEMHKFIGYK